MSRRRFASRTLLGLAVLAWTAAAQAPSGEAQVKAAFVYNFLKFVEWPARSFHSPDEPLVVALVGTSPTADATELFLATRQIGTRRLVVRRVAWDQSLAGVHAALVSEGDVDKLRRVLAAASAGSVLSIGEGATFAGDGGVIGLVVVQRKVRFDIDLRVANAAGLKVSSKLLALTRTVYHGQDGPR